MNRLSPSREPAAWIGLTSAAVAFAAVLGLHAPQGFEAALAAVVTALGAVVIRSQVTPAKKAAPIKAHPAPRKTPRKKAAEK